MLWGWEHRFNRRRLCGHNLVCPSIIVFGLCAPCSMGCDNILSYNGVGYVSWFTSCLHNISHSYSFLQSEKSGSCIFYLLKHATFITEKIGRFFCGVFPSFLLFLTMMGSGGFERFLKISPHHLQPPARLLFTPYKKCNIIRALQKRNAYTKMRCARPLHLFCSSYLKITIS